MRTRIKRIFVHVIRAGSPLLKLNGPTGSGPPLMEPNSFPGGLGLTDATSNHGREAVDCADPIAANIPATPSDKLLTMPKLQLAKRGGRAALRLSPTPSPRFSDLQLRRAVPELLRLNAELIQHRQQQV